MQKLIEQLKNEYEARLKSLPLHLSIKGNSGSEEYELVYAAKNLYLNAVGEKGALLGLHHLLFAEERWPEFLGKQRAKLPMRALWVEGDEVGFLSESVFCSYPKKLKNDPSLFWLYKLGFNTLIFGGLEQTSKIPFPKFSFPYILKPTICDKEISVSPLDDRHKERIRPLKNCLFESLSLRPSFWAHPESNKFTQLELQIKEAHLTSPLFYMSENPEMRLIDEFEKGASCVVKEGASLLKELPKTPHPSETPLIFLSILNEKTEPVINWGRTPFEGLIVKISSWGDPALERKLVNLVSPEKVFSNNRQQS